MVNHVASTPPPPPFRWKYVDDVTVGEYCRNTAHVTPPPKKKQPQHLTSDHKPHVCPGHRGNHIILSINKCAVLQFSLGRNPPPPPLVFIADYQKVAIVTSMTLLGVTCPNHSNGQPVLKGYLPKPTPRKDCRSPFWPPEFLVLPASSVNRQKLICRMFFACDTYPIP